MRSRKLSGLLGGTALLLLALLCLPALPLRAQTSTPATPQITFTPRPSSTPTATPTEEPAPLRIETQLLVDVPEPGSGAAVLVIEMTRLSGAWPAELVVAVTIPDGIILEQAIRADVAVPFSPGNAANEFVMLLAPPAEQTQQLRLALRFDPNAPPELAPVSARLLDSASNSELTAALPDVEQQKLETARPAAEDDTQQGPPAAGEDATEPASAVEPTTTTELAQAGDAAAEVIATVAPTDVPPTPVPATAQATAVATATADGSQDEADGGLSVSEVLWILLIAGGALLFLAVILLILLRVFRGSRQPASEPIAMRPGPKPTESAAPVASAAPAAVASAGAASTLPTATAPVAAGMATAATLAAVPSPVQKPGYLTLAADPGPRFDIAGERFTIGRSESNNLVVGDDFPDGDTVSRFHAAIYPQAGKTMIEDLNSHNGVWVNGQAVPKVALTDGAEVGIGGVTFIYHAGEVAGEHGGSAK